ncbi:MAG: hypothetical protein ACI35P_06560 [Bacillus sp. (in: firmicutes)]
MFSEKAKGGTKLDFEVLVGGEQRLVPAPQGTTGAQPVVEKVNVNTDPATIDKGISLKTLKSLDIVDEAGNKLVVPVDIKVSK